jgi:hypothetical protein
MKENRPIDREMKILLLSVLKKGYFSHADMELLSKKIVFNVPIKSWVEPMTIEVIDRREQVEQ